MSDPSTISTPESTPGGAPTPDQAAPAPLDLDRIEADLAAVEVALARLDSGAYWRDEVTGAPLDDDLLATDPLARRAT